MHSRVHVAVVVLKVVARRCVHSARARLSAPATGHVIAAGVVAGGLSAAACFTAPEVSKALELAAALAVAGIATSAVVHAVRRHRNAAGEPAALAILVATSLEVAPRHPGILAARVLEIACRPSALLGAGSGSLRPARELAGSALKKQIARRVTRALPGLGAGLDLAGAYRTALGGMELVSGFERAALELCAGSSLERLDAVGALPG